MTDKSMQASGSAIIYQSEMDFVSRCILDYPRIETGGQMFGYWTDDGTPVVLYTIGPGPHANHQPSFFNQDIQYLKEVGSILVHKYGLQHMGEWHSHHQLGLAHPSGHDASTMASGLAASGRNRFLLCIGNCTDTMSRLNPFNFVKGSGTDYVSAQWSIIEEASPFRAIIDAELKDLLVMPRTQQPNYEGMRSTSAPSSQGQKPLYEPDYWLAEKQNNLVLKAILDYMTADPAISNLQPMLDENKHVCLLFRCNDSDDGMILFPDGFPTVPPEFRLTTSNWRGKTVPRRMEYPEWRFTGDIKESFVEYYNNIRVL